MPFPAAHSGYIYKTKGLNVFTNDRQHYCFNILRVIIENNHEHLTTDEIDTLLRSNSKAVDFVQTILRGKFFQSSVHALIDANRANIDGLNGYKKDLAQFR